MKSMNRKNTDQKSILSTSNTISRQKAAGRHKAAGHRAGRNSTARKRADRRKQARQQEIYKKLLILFIAAAVILSAAIVRRLYRGGQQARIQKEDMQESRIPRPELDVDLLTVNEYSRPAAELKKVKGIVIHYTANPGTGASANRNYFEGLKDTHITKASSHFIIGLEGEIVQCIPSSEISYASNERNKDTISIECCIEDDTGRFNKATYQSMVHLTAWLVEHFELKVKDVIRHYDITGKVCPKYFVDFPSAWEQFLADVEKYLKSYGVS